MLREALALWRGPALAEFDSEPFAQTEAVRHGDLRLTALEERIEADLALGRHAEVIGEPASLIAETPYRERLRGQRQALSREGRGAEALAAYNRALVHAEAAGDQVIRRDVIGRMGIGLCDDSTPVGKAIQWIDELRRATGGDTVLDAGLCRCRAVLLAMAGRFDEATRAHRRERTDPRQGVRPVFSRSTAGGWSPRSRTSPGRAIR